MILATVDIGNILPPPYDNATPTVKNRNDASPPSGTSLHFHLILELQLTTPTKFIPFTLMRGT
jgi:hypothetical protein